jgi:ABC-type multidrug transport system fused ATPase/permease subunit
MLIIYCAIETMANISLFFGSSFILKSIISKANNQTLTLTMGIIYTLSSCLFNVASDAVWIMENLILLNSSFRASLDVLDMLLHHCLNHSIGYFNERLSGVLSNKIQTLARYVNLKVIRGISCCISCVMVYLTGMFLLFKITKSIPLLIFNIVWIISFYAVMYHIFKTSSELSKLEEENKSKASGIIIDCFTNISNVKMFASERKEFWIIKKQNLKILQSSLAIIKVKNIEFIITYIFICSFVFITTYVCFKHLLNGTIPLDTFIFASSYTLNICYNTRWAIMDFCRFAKETSSARNAMDTLLQPNTIKDRDNAIDVDAIDEDAIDEDMLNKEEKTQSKIKIQGKITFKNVSFAYNNWEKQ